MIPMKRTSKPAWKRVALFAILLSVSLAALATTGSAAPSSTLQVSFINVGQGDSILLRDETGFDVLIDGGRPSAGPTVVAYLQQQQVDDVDVMIATHGHDDHIGGLVDVLKMTDIPVQSVFFSGYPANTIAWSSFDTAVSQEGLSLTPLQYPVTKTWGSITTEVLNPPAGLLNPEQNDASVVLLAQHGSTRFLFTGDISSTAEEKVRARGVPVAAEILKVAHHGSATSSTSPFLAEVQPAEAIISVGRNSYGHPAAETLGRLAAVGARVWRTDRSGTIVVVDDGATYSVLPFFTDLLFLPSLQR
jgi:beta-lactamase superfamily II metal-dependent hydrolase